jgi:uncharacterized repeat protein (TIGR03803 family)
MKCRMNSGLSVAALLLLSAVLSSNAQPAFKALHSFTGGENGRAPYAGLVLSGNTLYGTTLYGGSADAGTVFAVNTDGSGYTNLHSFAVNSGYDSSGNFTNSDGDVLDAGLIVSGKTLYGTAYWGGTCGNGTVFAVNTDGSGFTTLHSFTAFTDPTLPWGSNKDGANPFAGLVLSSNTLYGTATYGGVSAEGAVFAINTDGSGFTNLYSFSGRTSDPKTRAYTNKDGAVPFGGLTLSGNRLFGTTADGGSSGNGTVFAVNTDGSSFVNLHNFPALVLNPPTPGTNSDGIKPNRSLLLSGNTLYGAAPSGGSSGRGTIFAINTNGSNFKVLYSFSAGSDPQATNSDGGGPCDGLILSGSTLYGTTTYGGSSVYGTIFAAKTDGTGFTTLYNFTHDSDGAWPYSGLVLSGSTLYGTASSCNDWSVGCRVVFKSGQAEGM